VAGDGLAGLSLALSRQPHLIALELMLPRLDGMQVCRKLRRESTFPIIMLAARHMSPINTKNNSRPRRAIR